MLYTEVKSLFDEVYPDAKRDARIDKPKVRTMWCDFLDCLFKDGEITPKQYDNFCCPYCKSDNRYPNL